MRGIHTCAPEAPSTINITQNIVQMDSETAFFVSEHFVGSQVTAGVLTLSHTPHAAASVQLALNSGVQRLGVDYRVVGSTVQFISFVPQATDVLDVQYFSTESGTTTVPSGDAFATGFTMGYSGATLPDGWLFLDGTTKVYDIVATEALYGFLSLNTHFVASSGTDGTGDYHVLKQIQTPYYSSGTMLAGNTIIKI